MNTRLEKDSFGLIAVPQERLWGAQTQRSLEHFHISRERMPDEIIHALALLKRACAKVWRPSCSDIRPWAGACRPPTPPSSP